MASVKKPDKVENHTKPEPPAPALAPVAPPDTHPVLLWGEGDTLTPYDAPGTAHEKEISVGGKWYSHVDVNDKGLWIYRNDRKN